jgi:hypothetical protein
LHKVVGLKGGCVSMQRGATEVWKGLDERPIGSSVPLVTMAASGELFDDANNAGMGVSPPIWKD